MTSISKADSTHLSARVPLYSQCSGHRQLACHPLPLSTTSFLALALQPLIPTSTAALRVPASGVLYGWRATAKAVLVSKKLDGARLWVPPAAASCQGESLLLLSAAAAGRKNQSLGLLLAGCALGTGAADRPSLLREENHVTFSLKLERLQPEHTKHTQLHIKQVKWLKNQTYTMRKIFGVLSKK